MENAGHYNWEVKGTTGVLTLGPPPENLLAQPEFIPLAELMRWTSALGLKGIVVHGQGRHFSAGADTKNLFEFITGGKDVPAMMNAGKALLDHLELLNIPLIAAISGICFGGGLEIALACHIRICAANALFAFPEVNHGILPGLGGTIRLPETVMQPEAMKMLLGGDTVHAEDALQIGLVHRVLPKNELITASMGLMDKMTRNRPLEVINAIMRALRNAEKLSREDAMAEETDLFCMLAKKEAERRAAEG
jgi:enoyl-CoA hydratase/carnithine racemase